MITLWNSVVELLFKKDTFVHYIYGIHHLSDEGNQSIYGELFGVAYEDHERSVCGWRPQDQALGFAAT